MIERGVTIETQRHYACRKAVGVKQKEFAGPYVRDGFDCVSPGLNASTASRLSPRRDPAQISALTCRGSSQELISIVTTRRPRCDDNGDPLDLRPHSCTEPFFPEKYLFGPLTPRLTNSHPDVKLDPAFASPKRRDGDIIPSARCR